MYGAVSPNILRQDLVLRCAQNNQTHLPMYMHQLQGQPSQTKVPHTHSTLNQHPLPTVNWEIFVSTKFRICNFHVQNIFGYQLTF